MDLQGRGVCTVLKSIMLFVYSINFLSVYIDIRTAVKVFFLLTCFSGDNGFPGLPGKNNSYCRTKVLTVVQQFIGYIFVSVGPAGMPGNPGREGQKGAKGSEGT